MEFGLQVGGMPVASLRELAALADERGFRYLTVPDHFVLEEPGSGLDVTKPSLEAIAVLGALAASTTYALGWTVATAQVAGTSQRVISHRGSPRGGAATLLLFPDLGLAVAVADNTGGKTGLGPLALEVAGAFARAGTVPRKQTLRALPPSNGPEDLRCDTRLLPLPCSRPSRSSSGPPQPTT